MAYNHPEVVKNLTAEQYTENLYQARNNHMKARNGELITCRGCGGEFKLHKLFRCFFCRSYFCPNCAKNHFE